MEMSWVVKGLPLPLRLGALALFAAAGAAVQVFVVGAGGTVLGLALMVPGLILVWAKNFKNKPMDIGLEDWQPATAAEFDRIRENLAASRQKSYSPLQKSWPGVLLIILSVFLSMSLGPRGLGRLGSLAFLDLAFLLVPFTLGGNVQLWTPVQLAHRMGSLQTVLSEEPEGGPIIVTPYLRLDKDKEGRQIPEDVRLMVEPRRKPADFLGVQMQVALNNGPNGTVPYLYAVFLCRGKGPSYRRVQAMDFENYVVDPGGDDEYGYVVVRQPTGGGGYNTSPADCKRLYRMVREKLDQLEG